jgi:hypothetical protein
VYTVFEGRLGAVDERLLAEGRLRRLADPEALEVVRRHGAATEERVRRDPALFAGLLSGTAGGP